MRNLYLIIFALLGLAGSAQSLADGAGGFPSLWDSYDVSLQKQLESTLKDLGLDAASRNSGSIC